jgi:ABC-type dipeptide/oligopeptide/nickel transport system permease component
MFERLKQALVESFVGAIALGYLLAQCILHFVNIFTSPVGVWFMRNEYRAIVPHTAGLACGLLRAALPEFVTFFLLLLVWYVLVRWLYLTPLKKETSEPAPNPEQAG